MIQDRVSQFISHFIGEFSLTEPEDRLRDQAEAFRHQGQPGTDFAAHAPGDVILHAPFDAAGHEAGLTPFWFLQAAQPAALFPPNGSFFAAPAVQMSFYAPDPVYAGARFGDVVLPQYFVFDVPPPGSVIVITHQFNGLIDNDLMLSGQGIVFTDPYIFDAQLDGLVSLAGWLSVPEFGDPLAAITDAPGFFTNTVDAFEAAVAGAPADATVTVLTGSDAVGVTINGLSAEEAPGLADLLPTFLRSPDAPEEDAGPRIDPITSAQISAEIFDVADGHGVVAGGNLVVNEVVLVSARVDAEVIAVMGDAISLTAISQVNVVQDHDAGAMEIAPTQAINAATLAIENSETPPPPTEDVYEGLPLGWGVTRIEADLVTLNWMHQVNLISDHDRAEVTFSGEDTYLNFDGNTALNQVSLLALSQGYDVIIVGGQMIDMKLIQQTNVLLDNDSVTYGGDWPADLSLGDNLAFNSATISQVGVDTHTGLSGAFAAAGEALADGAATVSATLTQDAMFAGMPTLSVLYIAGDLINVASITQTNIVGDADQISVQLAALDDRAEEPDGPVTVTTGSNAVVNLATILDFGLDSEIQVGGEVYDDLLLHQANLIESGDDPLSSGIAPLATEAVAFLADDMIATPSEDDPTLITPTDDGAVTTDAMQSMLA
ncbi:MAG: hypothetical protein AAF801_06010 [Pseudomonadota bacterium]